MRRIQSLVIVTGISGAGKTAALNSFEDMNYVTMDNIPCSFASFALEKFVSQNKPGVQKVALGLDIRSFTKISEFLDFIKVVEKSVPEFEIIFLDSSDEIILNRYNLTRRKHPVEADTLLESITKEKIIMSVIKEKSTRVIDTSYSGVRELSEKLKTEYYVHDKNMEAINIHIQSFGFKYGMPIDLDLVFDVRFLKNPYYIPELKPQNGNDAPVREYVMDSEIANEFYGKLLDMLRFLIPNYIKEGKKHLSIGIGCSGGKHRSVTIANLLSEDLKQLKNVKIYKSHREHDKGHW